MPLYEVFCIANATSSASQLVKLLKNTANTVNRTGGIIRRVDNLGVRALAMRARAHNKHHEYGRYMRIAVQISPPGLEQVKHRLRVDENVIRTTAFRAKLAPKFDPTQQPQEAQLSQREKSSKFLMEHEHPDPLVAEKKYVHADACQMLLKLGLATHTELSRLPRWSTVTSDYQEHLQQVYSEQQRQQQQQEQSIYARVDRSDYQKHEDTRASKEQNEDS